MTQITVSRRSYLLSQASPRLMRAAGRAASSVGMRSIAERRAGKQLKGLLDSDTMKAAAALHRGDLATVREYVLGPALAKACA